MADNTGSNLGTGHIVFSSKVGNDLQFKTLVGGTNITLANTASEITITASNDTTALNIGTGSGLFTTKAGDNIQFKSIIANAASGISLTSNADDLTLQLVSANIDAGKLGGVVSSDFLQKSNNLSGLTNLATARTNLSVYSKAEVDGFTVKNNANVLPSADNTWSIGNNSNRWAAIYANRFYGLATQAGSISALNNIGDVDTSGAVNNSVLKYNSSNSMWEIGVDTGGGGGSANFVGLSDTPGNFTGDANKYVRVNAGETALEFVDGVATEAYVTTQVNNLIDSAPGALDTLNELAAALGDDANFSTTITNSIATKLATADFNNTFDTRFGNKNISDLSNVHTAAPTDGQVLSWDNGNSRWAPSNVGSGDITRVNITAGTGLSGTQDTTSGDHTQTLAVDVGTSAGKIVQLDGSAKLPAVDGSALTNLPAAYTNASVDAHLNQSNPTSGFVLSWNGSDYAWVTNAGYTDTDFDNRLATKSTTNLTEGTNLYYTDARVNARVGALGSANWDTAFGWGDHSSAGYLSSVALNNLTDVNTAGVANGKILKYNGTSWVVADDTGGPADTDALGEGSTNLYFTNARADARISAATFTTLSDVDAVVAGDNGKILYYDHGTTSFKWKVDAGGPADTDALAEGSTNLYFTNARVDTHLNQSNPTSGYVLSWNGSDYVWVANGTPGAITDIVNDATPQLGGTLDANGNTIDMGTNVLTDVNLGQFITAHGWGDHSGAGYLTSTGVISSHTDVHNAAATDGQVLKWDNANSRWAPANDTDTVYSSFNSDFDTRLTAKDTGDLSEGSNLYFTNARADARIGAASINALSDVDTSGAANGKILKHNGTSWVVADDTDTDTGILNVVEDTTPQLGGNLDVQTNTIKSSDNVQLGEGVSATGITGTLATRVSGFGAYFGFTSDNSKRHYNNVWQSKQTLSTNVDTGNKKQGWLIDSVLELDGNTHGANDTADVSKLFGDYSYTSLKSSSGNTSANGVVGHSFSAEVTDASTNTVNTSHIIGIKARAGNFKAGSTATNAYGLYVDTSKDGAATITNRYSIYAPQSSDKAYFAGQVQIGAFTIPNTDGTNGQFLKTDGAGNLTWTSITQENLADNDTDDLSEGSSNLYFTNARADARIGASSLSDISNVHTAAPTDGQVLKWDNGNSRWAPAADTDTVYTSFNSDFDTRLAAKDTGDLSEGSNLYYTDARADARITNALIDEDNMASDSATKLPSQQSVKAYVDSQVASENELSEMNDVTLSGLASSQFLQYNGTAWVNVSSSAVPAGSDTEVQFNDGGGFAGDSDFTYNKTTNKITVGSVTTTGASPSISSSGALGISTTASNSDITITPHGTGDIVLDSQKWPQADGPAGSYLKTDGASQLSWDLLDTDDVGEGGRLYYTTARVDQRITGQWLVDEDNMASDSDTKIPSQQSVKAYVDAQILTKDNTDEIAEGSTNLYYTDARAQAVSINNLVEDTTPQLGGTLDANSNTIDMGTNIITDAKVGNWDTAHGWGDHSSAGYLTSISANSINDTHIDWGTGANQVSSADVPEQTNLYYTDARADARIGAASINALSDVNTSGAANGKILKHNGTDWVVADDSGGPADTDALSEGSSNLYFTNARADARIAAATFTTLSDVDAVVAGDDGKILYYDHSSTSFKWKADAGGPADTDALSEGSSNLYFTNARADARIGAADIADLNNVHTAAATDGQVLTWDNGNSRWAPADAGGGGTTTVERFKINYATNGNLQSITDITSGISGVNIDSAAGGDITITFTGYSYPPAGILYFGYKYASNEYDIMPWNKDVTLRKVPGGGSSGSPTAFGSISTISIKAAEGDTGASRSFGTVTHAWIQLVMGG